MSLADAKFVPIRRTLYCSDQVRRYGNETCGSLRVGGVDPRRAGLQAGSMKAVLVCPTRLYPERAYPAREADRQEVGDLSESRYALHAAV